jgi:hypothetical protein
MSLPNITSEAIYSGIKRTIAGGIGTGALYTQVQLISEFFAGSSTTLLHAIPLVSVSLALTMVAFDWSIKERAWAKALGSIILFLLLSVVSLSGTLGRVSEIGADKAAAASQARDTLANATRSLKTAQAAQIEAQDNVETQCARSAPKAKCKYWTAELTRREANTTKLDLALAAVPPVVDADATAKRIAGMTGLDAATVDRWYPALIPLGLELIVLFTFWIALAPGRAPRIPKHNQLQKALAQQPVTPRRKRGPGNRTTIRQADLTVKVDEWMQVSGRYGEMTVAQAFVAFEAWAQLDVPLSLVKFGKALTACGAKKRRLDGRVVICARA